MADPGDTRATFTILPLVQPTPQRKPIDRAQIRELCALGLSECPPEDRCSAWLALLHVFPDNPREWPDHREAYVANYRSYITDLGLADWHTRALQTDIPERLLDVPDQPLMHIINVDVSRTIHHIYFLPSLPPPEGAGDDINGSYMVHMRRLERILYVFGSVSNIQYNQGFNELVLPLYYVNYAAIRYLEDDPDEVEAITFQCFTKLVTTTDVQSFYFGNQAVSHLQDRMTAFTELIRKHLPDVQEAFDCLSIGPMVFAIGWFNALFGQEHQLPVLLIVWDALLAHIDCLMNYVAYVALAHLKVVRPVILLRNFADTVTAVQHPAVENIYPVLKDAKEMYEKDLAERMPPMERLRSLIGRIRTSASH
jgi:hypothetical protein